MPWLTHTELKTRLSGLLKQDPPVLHSYWDPIVEDSNDAAYNEIRAALALRGYTPTQMDQWDRRREYNRDLGLCWCLEKGAGLHKYDMGLADKLCERREELATVAFTIDGVLVAPEGSLGKTVGFGYQSDEKSNFSTGLADPETETRW